MLNQPWIDPRDVDWTDALNPVRNPGQKKNNNPFVYAALNDVFMQALRQGKGIQPRIYVCPDPANQIIPAGATFDYEVPSEPNSWLWALTASIQVSGEPSPDTFLFNITDSLSGAKIFSQPMNATMPQTSGRGPLSFISTPHLFTPPSYPVVRLVNVGANPLLCRVTLYTAVEYDL